MRPKEGGECEPASVHVIWQERRPKQKTETKTKTGEARAEQATRMQEEESRWAADADAAIAVQSQVNEVLRMIKDLQGQRTSIIREIKHHRAWVEAELKERAMAAPVEQVKGSMAELAAAQAQEWPLRDQGCVPQLQQVDQLQTDGAADEDSGGEDVLGIIGSVGAGSRAGQEETRGSRPGETDRGDGGAGQAGRGASGPPGQAG